VLAGNYAEMTLNAIEFEAPLSAFGCACSNLARIVAVAPFSGLRAADGERVPACGREGHFAYTFWPLFFSAFFSYEMRGNGKVGSPIEDGI